MTLEALISAVPVTAWLLASGIFYGLGEYLAKKWSLAPSFHATVAALLAYAACDLLYLPVVVKEHSLALAGVLFLIMAMLASVIIGVFGFGETLSWHKWVGIILAGIGMFLLEM